jgi:hypothetical protein
MGAGEHTVDRGNVQVKNLLLFCPQTFSQYKNRIAPGSLSTGYAQLPISNTNCAMYQRTEEFRKNLIRIPGLEPFHGPLRRFYASQLCIYHGHRRGSLCRGGCGVSPFPKNGFPCGIGGFRHHPGQRQIQAGRPGDTCREKRLTNRY